MQLDPPPDSTPASASSTSPPAWPVSFEDAQSIVLSHAAKLLASSRKIQICSLHTALGRVLAAPILADRDQPPFPRVTRDGFAVRAADVSAGIGLRVIGQLRAGQAWPSEREALRPGEAVEIMTGAPLPPGADAVLMVEHVREAPSDFSAPPSIRRILPLSGRSLAPGENVVSRGSEARQGQLLVDCGTRLAPEQIALAASCGLRELAVYEQPSVAILATGDELVDQAASNASASILQHQIYDSNSHSLAALLQQNHAIPVRQPPARDHRDDLACGIRQSFAAAPLLLLTGGVSMGKYDLVEEVLAAMGAEFFFTGVKMQPGKPVVFGRLPASADRQARYFFGLPGNPVSVMVTFRVFVQPLLAAMAGERHWQPRIVLAQLATAVQVRPGLTRFLPARLDTTGSTPTVIPVKTQGSGDLVANARANCYLIVPEDRETIAANETARVLLR